MPHAPIARITSLILYDKLVSYVETSGFKLQLRNGRGRPPQGGVLVPTTPRVLINTSSSRVTAVGVLRLFQEIWIITMSYGSLKPASRFRAETP